MMMTTNSSAIDLEPMQLHRKDHVGGAVKNHSRGKDSEPKVANDSNKSNSKGAYVHIDYSFHLKNDMKFAFTYSDDDESLGSSVCSGLRNSLHSSFDFKDFEDDNSNSDGSFGEISFGDQEEVPSWREHPDESQSDWTLTIQSVPDGNISQYHVHRTLLVNGYKRGEFFVSLFNYSGKDKDVEPNKLIKVHEDAASLLPNMLDYIYSLDDNLEISSESAAGLRHLSQFFGMKSLAKRVAAFMYEDICIDNMGTYLETAMAFDDLQTLKLCADICAQHIEEISSCSPLLPELDPSFMLDIVSSRRFNKKKHSRHMSRLIAVYCITQRDNIDGGVFEELTSIEYLPFFDEEAALPLLMLESRLVEESADETTPLTSLQRRSVKALLSLVNGASANNSDTDRKSRQKALSRVPKKVLIEILSRSIC